MVFDHGAEFQGGDVVADDDGGLVAGEEGDLAIHGDPESVVAADDDAAHVGIGEAEITSDGIVFDLKSVETIEAGEGGDPEISIGGLGDINDAVVGAIVDLPGADGPIEIGSESVCGEEAEKKRGGEKREGEESAVPAVAGDGLFSQKSSAGSCANPP